ncbi:MAG: prepilin peptidase [Clostridiales bacterium]|nr:prepilin peptidase [Clostridiales bacterium]
METAAIITMYIFIFLFGIIIGSFLNVCIFRIPKKESIVPSSHCMSCGARLRWYDLIPVFSYVFLRGKCRRCGSKISIQYPIIEASNGLLYLLTFFINGFNLYSIILCLMASALLVIAVIDERTFEIPASLNIFLLVLGVLSTALDWRHFISHLVGFVCVSLVLLILYLASSGRAIGGGDIKLMAVAGLIIGWKDIVLAFLLGCILGAVIHLIRMKVSKKEHVLAMGPYLAAGVYVCALFGEKFISWYLSLILA